MKYLLILLLYLPFCGQHVYANPASGGEGRGELTLRQILAAYIEAQGGQVYIDSIETLRMEGTIAQGDQLIPFVQVKRRPDLMRMTLDLGSTELIMGFNGETAWQTTRGRPQSIELTGEDRAGIIQNSTMFSALYQSHDPKLKATLVGEDVYDGVPVYIIDVQPGEGIIERYAIDQGEFLERKMVLIQTIDGTTHHTEFLYKNIQCVGKLKIPFRIDSYCDENLRSVIAIHNISINTGIYGPYFDPPGGIEGKDQPSSRRAGGSIVQRAGGTITGSGDMRGM